MQILKFFARAGHFNVHIQFIFKLIIYHFNLLLSYLKTNINPRVLIGQQTEPVPPMPRGHFCSCFWREIGCILVLVLVGHGNGDLDPDLGARVLADTVVQHARKVHMLCSSKFYLILVSYYRQPSADNKMKNYKIKN